MREIYIFFEHPTPATHSTLPPGCTSPPAAACQHQRFVSRRMCGRARLTNCRNPCTGYSHLPLAPCSCPCPCPCCCPHSLAKPLAAQPTRYLSFNATHHQQQRRFKQAAAEANRVEAASYFIHGEWQLHVNCDAATWPATAAAASVPASSSDLNSDCVEDEGDDAADCDAYAGVAVASSSSSMCTLCQLTATIQPVCTSESATPLYTLNAFLWLWLSLPSRPKPF